MTKEERRAVRKDLGRVNRFTLLYSLVFTFVTLGAMAAGVAPLVADNPDVALEKVQEVMNQQSGVTSLTALIFGLVFILLNRRRQLFASDLRTPDRRTMTAPVFFAAVALLFTAQVLFFALDPIVRWVAEQFGYSMYTTSDSLEDASGTLAMILYAGFLGPIVEEVIFRGVVLRGLQSMAKSSPSSPPLPFSAFSTATSCKASLPLPLACCSASLPWNLASAGRLRCTS